MTDLTTEILQQLRAEVREVRDGLGEVRDGVQGLGRRMDNLEVRHSAVEYLLKGMATDVQQIPELARLLRQVADIVADHETRLGPLEGES